MKEQRKLGGNILLVIGVVLSPLSWWNDPVVNIPLAYGFGSLVGWIFPSLFMPAVIVGYWLTNWLGLVLMHKGAAVLKPEKDRTNVRNRWLRDAAVVVLYTIGLVVLIKLRILRFPGSCGTQTEVANDRIIPK